MKLGRKLRIDGELCECVRYRMGKPVWQSPDGRTFTRPASAEVPTYTIGETVRIVGVVAGGSWVGEIVCLDPVTAKVTERDPVWHGAEITTLSHFRKVKA